MMLDMTTPTTRRRRRADAERSIASIVAAAVELFSRRPDVSMTEIAAAAGVGRVTLYAHFPSREALLDAAIDRALTQAIAALDGAELDEGPASDAIRRMVRTGWPILDRHRGLLAAVGDLPLSRLRQQHAGVLSRIDRLLARGQADGVVRADLPRGWLVSACYSLFHTAALEVSEGRLDPAIATDVLETTILAALAPKDGPAR